MARTLLLVDDIRANREILKKILGSSYLFLEAGDGGEAMSALLDHGTEISAVLLDLAMPVMTGYEVLTRMKQTTALAGIPVIVMTGDTEAQSEVKALSLGAMDYLAKPYNPDIVKQRIRNTINLRETSAALNALQRDRLTGLYNREAFFDRVPAMLEGKEPSCYVLSCFDIDNFKVINDQYGTKTGDRILRMIADALRLGMEEVGGLCCRMNGDNFACLYPANAIGTRRDVLGILKDRLAEDPELHQAVTFSAGRCVVTAPLLSASTLYDRAYMAKQSVKGRYDEHVAYFDESMLDSILLEQRIISEMDAAIQERQFEVWYQPQFNHSTGALIGAEALVRWRHPERGLISPGTFIPVFEKNGFIYELDKYVWEETCANLSRWVREGRSPLPVSVNISRYDIFRPDLIQVVTGLIKRYELPVELLRLEITESAFAESTDQIVRVVKTFIELGFTVEIDDFGSGYSSLNTLKAVPAQVVKLDMRFMEDDGDSQRGGNILESIVRMTKWLGMSVIAEGVEELEQANFLSSIGCSYVQGFLYAKPMPLADYETLAGNAGKEERLIALTTVENLDNNAFWDPRSMDTLIFNSYVGAACIFEYQKGRIEMLRANDKFREILGAGLAVEDTLKLDWIACLAPKSRETVRQTLGRTAETGEDVPGEYTFLNIPGAPQKTYLRAVMRAIATAGDRSLIYCSCENVTAQRQAEEGERRVAAQLKTILDNVNCGITAVIIRDNRETAFLLANDRYYGLLGYTKAQFEAEVDDPYRTIYSEDRERVASAIANTCATGRAATLEYRIVRRDGSTVWVHTAVSMTSFDWVAEPVQLCIYTDVTAEMNANRDLLDNLPGGAGLYEFDGKALTPIHLNKRYWELVGREPTELTRNVLTDAIHPEDRQTVFTELTDAIQENRDVSCDIRIKNGTGGYRPFHIMGRVLR